MAFYPGTATVAAARDAGAVFLVPLDAGAPPFALVAVPASPRIARASYKPGPTASRA
jgi:hypothetical protein